MDMFSLKDSFINVLRAVRHALILLILLVNTLSVLHATMVKSQLQEVAISAQALMLEHAANVT